MVSKYSKDDIYNELKKILIEEFEIDNSKITLNTNLFDDLDLDSIDAVDIAVKLQKFTDKKLPPEKFKEIKTIDNVVEAVYALLTED